MRGKEALEVGTQWHVGNDEKISVFKVRWLPRPCSFRPAANPLGFSNELRVSDLINRAAKEWIKDVILEAFIPADAELILEMRILGEHVEDEVIWHYNKNGLFSVKSVYHMLLTQVIHRDH